MFVRKHKVSVLVGSENFLCLSIFCSFPFSWYCKHGINSTYVQVLLFCVCSTFQKLRDRENFRRIVGGPSNILLPHSRPSLQLGFVEGHRRLACAFPPSLLPPPLVGLVWRRSESHFLSRGGERGRRAWPSLKRECNRVERAVGWVAEGWLVGRMQAESGQEGDSVRGRKEPESKQHGWEGKGAERGKIRNWNGEEEEKFGVFVAQPERRKLDNFVLCLARRHFVDGGGLEKQLPYCCFPPMWMILQLACMLEFPPSMFFLACRPSLFYAPSPVGGIAEEEERREAPQKPTTNYPFRF